MSKAAARDFAFGQGRTFAYLRRMERILFICLGNICRSATAEEVFRTLASRAGMAKSVEADSAGMIDYHEGELPDPRMRDHAYRRGYRLTHRSRPVCQADFDRFDRLIVMDANNEKALRRLVRTPADAAKISRMADYLQRMASPDIPDPYYGGPEGFEHVIDLLEDACRGLLEDIRRTS